MASFYDERRRAERRRSQSRPRAREWLLWSLVLVASVFALGLFAGNALAGDARAAAAGGVCERVYSPVPVIVHHGQLVPLHPALRPYTRCVRARSLTSEGRP